MVGYLRTISILLILVLAFSQSADPKASCVSFSGLKDLPITLHEVELLQLNDFIRGLNIQYSLSKDAPDFVRLTQKFEMKAEKVVLQKGLKNYHIDTVDNTWGSSFITLTEDNSTSTVRWGRLSAADTVPEILGEVTVESEQNIDCFDAIRFDEEGLVMVDCALKSGTEQQGYVYKNRFIYVDMRTQTIIPYVYNNELYGNFRKITHRKFFKYTELGYHYLMRVYFAEGVDVDSRNNTYLQIMSANNPRKPFVLRVIDRSFLDLPRLSITDFDLYLGDMYILDYHSGLLKFDITGSQSIVITGYYRTDSGFLKFGVYSDNLDNQFLLVLANSHAIYEIDWTNQIQPKTLTKYSIMQDSRINSLWVNRDYVVVQAEANTTGGHGFLSIYNVTWVFNRNSRTFSNAYTMLPHDSENTFVDFNREHSFLLSIDEESIQNWALGTPRLIVNPTSDAFLDQEFSFTVKGTSLNPVTSDSLNCTFPLRFVVVKPDNYTIWPTGLVPSNDYYSNYPGELIIPLAAYAFGPNITWGVHEQAVDGQLPNYWILQQNSSRLNFNEPLNMSKITFLRQEQYDTFDNTVLFMYLQDSNSQLYVGRCLTQPFKVDVNCTQIYRLGLDYQVLNLTVNRFHYYQQSYLHLAAFTLTNDTNSLYIFNIERNERFAKIAQAPGYEGRITALEYGQHYLFVVRRFAKSIDIYDMIRCEDYGVQSCKPVYTIDAEMMYNLGEKYFAPLDVYTSDFHPFVLFIQTTESVLALDITRKGPILLNKITSSATKEVGYYGWSMAISRNRLVIVNAPNSIEEHDLRDLSKKRTYFTRVYPLYTYEIPENFDLDFSDAGDLIYITAKEKATGNGVLLVYKAGLPSVSSFYDVFNMRAKYQDVLIDATGVFTDYVLMSAGNTLQLFRQFQFPLLVIEDTFSDFSFNITYTNAMMTDYFFLAKSNVHIANYPVSISIIDPKLNDTQYLNSLLDYKNDNRSYVINDHGWFNGTILNYSISCEDCGHNKSIRLVNHVQITKEVVASHGMTDYAFTIDGGIIQQVQGLAKLRHNGSIDQFITIPNSYFGENCQRVAVDFLHNAYVSGCVSDSQVLLYLTSESSSRPFTMGPQSSTATNVANLQMYGGLLILTDVDEHPEWRAREGAIFLYALNTRLDQPEFFDQLEVIDSNDFQGTLGWTQQTAYLGNAHIVWTNETDFYRLLITEVNNGLFVVDFYWRPPRREVTIKQINFIDLHKLLTKKNIPLPNNANFESVTIINQHHDQVHNNWILDIVVGIRNFHNIHINVLIDSEHMVLDTQLIHVYYRYIFYESTNYIKAFDGYFVTTQIVPPIFDWMDSYSKQIVSVYDTRPNRTESQFQDKIGDIPASHMMGGVVLHDTNRVTFDFNFTIRRNDTDPFSNIGLVMVDSHGMTIREITLSESIHITTLPGLLKSQDVELTAQNDFSKIKLPIKIHIDEQAGEKKLAWWAILLIVLGSVLLAAGIGYGIHFYFKKKQQGEDPDNQKSLLEKEAESEEQGAETEGQPGNQQQTGQEHVQEESGENVQENNVIVPEEQAAEPIKEQEEVPIPISREGAVNESVNLEE